MNSNKPDRWNLIWFLIEVGCILAIVGIAAYHLNSIYQPIERTIIRDSRPIDLRWYNQRTIDLLAGRSRAVAKTVLQSRQESVRGFGKPIAQPK